MPDSTIKCVAIDDEPLALRLIEDYIKRTPGLELLQKFEDAIAGQEFLRNNSVDILFLDINMPDITGIDVARSLDPKTFIIFTTAYKKFAFDGFELGAVDYLLKPIEFGRFEKAVQKAIALHQQKTVLKQPENDFLFVRAEYRMLKIDVDTIECIEGLEDYIKIHIINSKPILTLMTMKAVLEKLPPSKFRRIHRSYIIATGRVVSILNKKVTLASSKEIPVSDSYIDFISEWTQKTR
ncbi:MAG: response regulator transcription factor [Bacteroidetes bacterium]|nr:response regulator transcription factor [Bacteroidota bacterium]